MKKVFTKLMAAALCSAMAICPLSVSAYDDGWVLRTAEPLTIETENFTYISNDTNPSPFSDRLNNVKLMSDSCDAEFMITGAFYYPDQSIKYTWVQVNSTYCSRGYLLEETLRNAKWEGQELQVGDLLRASTWMIIADRPAELGLEGAEVYYVGNAVDLWGEEALPMLRQELYLAPNEAQSPWTDYEILDGTNQLVLKGDVMQSGEVTLLDVVAVNKSLLGGMELDVYGKLAADVNNNGNVEATDALNILKYVVEVIDSFD